MKSALVLVALVVTMSLGISTVRAQSPRSEIAARKGPVSRLIELERRKNEWLRQRFAR